MSIRITRHLAILLALGLALGCSQGKEAVAARDAVPEATTGPHFQELTSDPLTPRYGHQANTLADGRVLFCGGKSTTRTLKDSEIYDPSTGKFRFTADLNVRRYHPLGTTLPDGRVFIFGGLGGLFDGDAVPQASGELYDPVMEQYTLVSAPDGVYSDTEAGSLTLLDTGQVLILHQGRFQSDALLYTPSSGFKTLPASSFFQLHKVGRSDFATATLPDGRVFICGGAVQGVEQNPNLIAGDPSTEFYDPSSNTFTPGPNMPFGLLGHRAVPLSDGSVLIFGGSTTANELLTWNQQVLRFNPSTHQFQVASTAFNLLNHSATVLTSGKVFAMGGLSDLATLFDPSTNAVVASAHTTGEWIEEHTATLLPDGSVLVVGGVNRDFASGLPFLRQHALIFR